MDTPKKRLLAKAWAEDLRTVVPDGAGKAQLDGTKMAKDEDVMRDVFAEVNEHAAEMANLTNEEAKIEPLTRVTVPADVEFSLERYADDILDDVLVPGAGEAPVSLPPTAWRVRCAVEQLREAYVDGYNAALARVLGAAAIQGFDASAVVAAAPDMVAAVAHLLRRIGEDPGGLGYYAGFATQTFELAVRAYARARGHDESTVRDGVLYTQSLHADPELELRALKRRVEELE